MARPRSVVEDQAMAMKTTQKSDRRTDGRTATRPRVRPLEPRVLHGSRPRTPRKVATRHLRRRGIVVAVLALGALGVFALTRPTPQPPSAPEEIRGSSAWAAEHYGNPNAPGYVARNITTIDFLGRSMQVHKKAARHFLRLEALFEARAPEYAAAVALGELDDWSYENRVIRGETLDRSNHAFGLAIDINALTNILGTVGDMPAEVVAQWELEGGDWGGDWTRPDPMHFETHLTPSEIVARYRPDGSPKDWYLEELVGG